MSIRSKAVKKIITTGSFTRSDPSQSNLDKKRRNFSKIGKWMKPEKGTQVKRYQIDGVDVDEIINCKPTSIIVYAHGGGFVYGGNQVHMHMLSMLSRLANAKILAVDYRTAPEHPYPAALNDVLKVFEAVSKQNDKNIFLIGDSAGGNLVLASAIKLRDEGKKLPAKVVAISPATDATFTNKWIKENSSIDKVISIEKLDYFLNAYTNQIPRKDPRISPYFADVKNLPPSLFHVGSDEVMFGDSFLFHEKIKDSGGQSEIFVGEGMWHVWHLFTKYTPESRAAIQNIASFLKS